MPTKLKYGDASEIQKAEIAAGIIEPPKNEGKTAPSPPIGNERTYKDEKNKEAMQKKSWWPW